MPSEKRKFQLRLAKRTYRHGKNWRQIFVDCGGMCILCGNVDSLEFHEPFGESKFGWGVFQTRVILCNDCHSKEHEGVFTEDRYIRPSLLSQDVAIETLIHGGYYKWLKKFNLQDTFGRLIVYD